MSHLVPIGDQGWSLWKWFWLRGAGFASSYALNLGSSELESALHELDDANTDLQASIMQALQTCESAQVEDEKCAKQIGYARNDLKRDGLVKHRVGFAPVDSSLDAVAAAANRRTQASEGIATILASDELRASRHLIRYCNDPLFLEALLWQNRSAYENSAQGLATIDPEINNARSRERKRLVARYIQRYALKNDTIGFFGPVGWSQFDVAKTEVELVKGPLISKRDTFFEDWVISALAEKLSFSEQLLPICSLRTKTFSWMEGCTLHRPPAEPLTLSEEEALVLRLAHASATIQELGQQALLESKAFASVELVYEVVQKLVKSGNAIASIEIPAEVPHPEKHLRALLESMPSCEDRELALAELGQLESDLLEVAGAAGSVEPLREAIAKLEYDFTAITAREAKRGHGKVYAGRQIFFEDCLRGGSLVIGANVIDELSSPLSLLLQSARWFTYEVSRRFRDTFSKRYRQWVEKEGSSDMPLSAFLVATKDLFGHAKGEVGRITQDVQTELRKRWGQVFDIDLSAKRVSIRSADCRAQVDELFAAPGPGWPAARYQAPDLMIAAASTEAINRGEYLAVLGELHAGVNTLLARVAHYMHPERELVRRALESDISCQRITPVQPTADRTSTVVWDERAYHVELGEARSWRPRKQVFSGGDFYVVEIDDQLHVKSRSKPEVDFDIIQFMDHYLSAEASPHFRVFPKVAHMPRVTLDKLVISRERWSLKRQDFSLLLTEEGREQQFMAVRSWAKSMGLPRFVFAVVPQEAKPFYVDLASPVYVEMFLKFLSRAPTLELSEMLPAHGEHWLEGEDQQSYSSELRIAAVDPVPWSAELPKR